MFLKFINVAILKAQEERFKKMENYAGIERHKLTHRVVHLTGKTEAAGPSQPKKMKKDP